MQRICKYGDIQNTSLSPDKEPNIIWYIDRLPTSLYAGAIHFQKWSNFFGPPCIVSSRKLIIVLSVLLLLLCTFFHYRLFCISCVVLSWWNNGYHVWLWTSASANIRFIKADLMFAEAGIHSYTILWRWNGDGRNDAITKCRRLTIRNLWLRPLSLGRPLGLYLIMIGWISFSNRVTFCRQLCDSIETNDAIMQVRRGAFCEGVGIGVFATSGVP